MKVEGYSRCPHCGIPVERLDGCHFVTCDCGHIFVHPHELINEDLLVGQADENDRLNTCAQFSAGILCIVCVPIGLLLLVAILCISLRQLKVIK